MQRNCQYNNSPRSVTFYSQDCVNDEQGLFTIADNDILALRGKRNLDFPLTFHVRKNERNEKCDNSNPFTQPIKKTITLEKRELEKSKVDEPKPQETNMIYESPLQAFMNELLAKQCLPASSIADDHFMIRLPSNQNQDDNIPELQESYSSSDVATDNEDDYNDIHSTEQNENYDDLPLLIDVARDMRFFM
jgi:hypothetical protein